jgi:hypothetical protein
MGEVPGLIILSSNYEFTNIVDTPEEIEVTTRSNVQLAESAQLTALGWVAKAQNVYSYQKLSTEEVDVEEEVEQNFEIANEPFPEEVVGVVEKETSPSAEGVMDDV